MAEFLQEVFIQKLIHGGQGLGELSDGRKVFVWNALPGEKVRVRLTKTRHSYAEAVAAEVVQTSNERVDPREANYLATSPWQIMNFEAENRYKLDITREIFKQQKITMPDTIGITHDERMWHYRNKMEYSFWGDGEGLHLALHQRGSHTKQVVEGSALALPALDKAADSIRALLQKMNVWAGGLNTIIVRCAQNSDVAGGLFVRQKDFPRLELPAGLKGLRVYYSNPKTPASVRTGLLQELGDCRLEDSLLGKKFTYDVDSFFQVNVPIFERALERIRDHIEGDDLVDMYAGVGSIGLSVARRCVDLVEVDPATAKMLEMNAANSDLGAQIVTTPAEKALNLISGVQPIIFDPPRAGLHGKVVERILEVRPPKIVYLSCNPATQARDLARLQQAYGVEYFEVFNFFPRTPHIETLAVLVRQN